MSFWQDLVRIFDKNAYYQSAGAPSQNPLVNQQMPYGIATGDYSRWSDGQHIAGPNTGGGQAPPLPDETSPNTMPSMVDPALNDVRNPYGQTAYNFNFTPDMNAMNDFAHEEAILAHERSVLTAQDARNWEAEMSNTQYQRMVADMEKAGLNPLLAYSHSPTGMPTATAPSSPMASRGDATVPFSSTNATSIVTALINMVGKLFT